MHQLPTKSQYATLLGMLIYVLRTRPDVAYAVNRLATRASSPTTKDYAALCQVANYLYTTGHLELVYNSRCPRQRNTAMQLYGFVDFGGNEGAKNFQAVEGHALLGGESKKEVNGFGVDRGREHVAETFRPF